MSTELADCAEIMPFDPMIPPRIFNHSPGEFAERYAQDIE